LSGGLVVSWFWKVETAVRGGLVRDDEVVAVDFETEDWRKKDFLIVVGTFLAVVGFGRSCELFLVMNNNLPVSISSYGFRQEDFVFMSGGWGDIDLVLKKLFP
jgi:hypothetical protein